MNLWAVTMVKDELDVLPYTLQHLASEGVEGIIVADNLSTDGTWEFLREASVPGAVLVVQRDDEVGYYQSEKMTALARQAFSYGANAVIPFDADEIWYSNCPEAPMAVALDEVLAADVHRARMFNHYPTRNDDETELNPFRRLRFRDPIREPLGKVVVTRPDLTIVQGNHDAEGDEVLRSKGCLEIAHFPYRSYAQFERKVRNGAAAYFAAPDLPLKYGEHWRRFGEMLVMGGPEALQEHYNRWICGPPQILLAKPAPWCRFAPGRR